MPKASPVHPASGDPNRGSDVSVRLEHEDGVAVLFFSGSLDNFSTAHHWNTIDSLLPKADASNRLILDLSDVEYLDGAGAALLLKIRLQRIRRGYSEQDIVVRGLAEERHKLLDSFPVYKFIKSLKAERSSRTLPEEVGRNTMHLLREMKELIVFVGEVWHSLFLTALNPKRIRWKDVLTIAENVGVNALPIIALVGFLMGMVLAFQSAVPLKQFGADIYIADMLAISLTRELGPLVTAILLAGRSGSAFAAEIGTMKVNEEINALVTMGLNPVRFLAVPRILAAMGVIPFLTMFFNLFALIGGAFVVFSLGYPLVTYVTRVFSAMRISYIIGGLIKAEIFSILVAGIGCRRGLATGTGAEAVGKSTTSSVVGGLILIAISDGILAVMYYSLGF